MSDPIERGRSYHSPRIRSVEPGNGDFVLQIAWENGDVSRVDVTEPIFALKHFRPLRDKSLFRKARVGDWGWTVAWSDDLDFSAEQLWEMAETQAEAALTPSEFRAWLKEHGLTQGQAANLLGLSKRTISYYCTGAQPITRLVALALKGADAEGKGASR